MVKAFYLAASLLFLITFSVGIHYIFTDRVDVADKLSAVAGLTQMGSPSLSVAYYEQRMDPRVQGVEKANNIIYPEMMPVDRMDFVYEK